MKFFRFFTIIAALLIPSLVCIAIDQQPATSDEVVNRLLDGQQEIFERDYDGAMAVFESLRSGYPDSPAGDFGKMAVFEMRMLEREDFHLEKEFLAAAKEGTAKANAVLRLYHPNEWDLFLAGSLIGLDGFFKARKGNWWDAYVAGGKSRQIFRRVKEMDPSFTDADFGLGMYVFWRSVFAKDLWFLRMFPDRRQEGVGIVEKVAKDGRVVKDIARSNLAIMYMEMGRFPDAKKLLDEYTIRYPKNVILRNLLGKACLSLNLYAEAINQFRAILSVDPSFTKPHYFIGAAYVKIRDPKYFGEAEKELRLFLEKDKTKYWQASAHYWLGNLEEARGNSAKAKEEYEAAVKINPKAIEAQKKVRALGGGV